MVDANILPCMWRRKEADKLMTFGDEPAHLPNLNVLHKAKEQRHNVDLGVSVSDPVENIKRMKYDIYAGHIHSIGSIFRPLLDTRTNSNIPSTFKCYLY